jgi:hypothetical protein
MEEELTRVESTTADQRRVPREDGDLPEQCTDKEEAAAVLRKMSRSGEHQRWQRSKRLWHRFSGDLSGGGAREVESQRKKKERGKNG